MPLFPTSSSILSPKDIGAFIQARYTLSSLVSCKLLKAGVNHSYLVETGSQKFVFRVYCYLWRTRQEVEEEMRLLLYLNDAQIPVSYPVEDSAGLIIQSLEAAEGMRWAVLFSYAEGEKRQYYPESMHRRVGDVVANMHLCSEEFVLGRTSYNTAVLLEKPLCSIANFLSADTEEMDFLKRSQEKLLAAFEKMDRLPMKKGVVHVDLWYDNFHITPQSELTLFDFDFCGNGYLCLDLAYYLLQQFAMNKDSRTYEQVKSAFLEGYRQSHLISEQEQWAMPYLGLSLYFFYLGVQCDRFNDWSNVFLSEGYLKKYIHAFVKPYADRLDFGVAVPG